MKNKMNLSSGSSCEIYKLLMETNLFFISSKPERIVATLAEDLE